MYQWLRTWFGSRLGREECPALAMAIEHFERTTGKQAFCSMSRVLQQDAKRSVIRVCYNSGYKPLGRAWFIVPAVPGEPIKELTFEDVQGFGERRWR